MSLVYLGSLTTADVCPALPIALASALPRIQAQLAGAINASAQLTLTPPTIFLALELSTQLVANIQASIALGVQVPALSVQLNLLASLILSLEIELGALGFDLGAAGIHAYAYAGPANGLGPALPSSFPGGATTDFTNALVLATSVPASWIALGAILKTA